MKLTKELIFQRWPISPSLQSGPSGLRISLLDHVATCPAALLETNTCFHASLQFFSSLLCLYVRLRPLQDTEWKEMSMQMGNETTVQEFILEGFPSVQHLGKVLFFAHVLAYLASTAGIHSQSSSPMLTPGYRHLCIFPQHLLLLWLCFTSVVIPKLLVIFLLGKQMISFSACFTLAFVSVFLGATGFFFIAGTSLDRYVAIRKPLHYTTIMNLRTCFLLVMAGFALSFTVITGLIVKVSQLSFCGCHVIPFSLISSVTLPPDSSLLFWHQICWNVGLCHCFVCPFDILLHNHHCIQQHSDHNRASPIR